MGGEGETPAKVISEKLLEITGKALLSGDFPAFAECVHLPHFIASSEDKTVLETTEDLHRIFKLVTLDYAVKRVTDLVRFCEIAEYKSPTRIDAVHITHAMAGNERVVEPFPTFSELKLTDGRWQIASSQYAVDSQTTVGYALRADR
jgi:hypothetical protein